jgi:hypothetical protein
MATLQRCYREPVVRGMSTDGPKYGISKFEYWSTCNRFWFGSRCNVATSRSAATSTIRSHFSYTQTLYDRLEGRSYLVAFAKSTGCEESQVEPWVGGGAKNCKCEIEILLLSRVCGVEGRHCYSRAHRPWYVYRRHEIWHQQVRVLEHL